MSRVLTMRELNRTSLRRQWLLERQRAPATRALEHLVGLQAQLARPPYVGLWTRLEGFRRDDLADEIEQRHVVKVSLMRATLHLVTVDDFLQFRGTFQPVLTSALESVQKARGVTVDAAELIGAARRFMQAQPRSFAELTQLLTDLHPDADAGAMRYAVRTHLPMVQVPTSTTWSYPGNPKFALAENWLGKPVSISGDRTRDLVERYLAAFGPASVKDMETWSYLPDLAPVFDTMRSGLVTCRDERGRELFDLPDLDIEGEDAAAPVRFLPEFDNIVLAHQDRTRFVPTAARKSVYLPGLRVAATVLIDGFVGGTWTTERAKGAAVIRVVLFEPAGAALRKEIEAEAERLVPFVEPDASSFQVKFTAA